ncbi:MAG: YraN family protein [Lachnospiraceae bacterium]|nr:YraN family protein [Lachnospiraceae bacterium]
MNKRKIGSRKEELAASYIEAHGGRVIDRNYRSRMGEIDLIANDDGTTCFIEVKYRSDIRKGYPAEAVDGRKQFTICRTSDHYRMKKGLSEDIPYRFDVISIVGSEITWYKNAFQYIGL